MTSKERSSDNTWVTILSTLLAISLALNIILYAKGSDFFPQKKEMAAKNIELNKQVQKYKSEINKYSGISSKIDKVVADANVKLEAKEKQIVALKREKWAKEKENRQLAIQIDSLQETYLGAIDSLLVEREKSKVINQKIESLEDVIAGLHQRIGAGSVLLGDNLQVSPLKKNTEDKRQPSAMAKKTTEIEVCIDILENRLSKSGMRNLYFVLTSPNAEVVFDKTEDQAFEFYNPEFKTNALCSSIMKIDYKNKKVSVCTSIKPKSALSTGLYVLEVFSDDQKLGMTTFTLR